MLLRWTHLAVIFSRRLLFYPKTLNLGSTRVCMSTMTGYHLPHINSKTWLAIRETLENPIGSWVELEAAVEGVGCASRGSKASGGPPRSLPGLRKAVAGMEPWFNPEGVKGWFNLVETLRHCALSAPKVFTSGPTIPVLPSGIGGGVELTSQEVRCIMALLFFDGLAPRCGCGDPSFGRLYSDDSNPVGVARLQCHLSYYQVVMNSESDPTQGIEKTQGGLRVSRRFGVRKKAASLSEGQIQLPDWQNLDHVYFGEIMIKEEQKIEDSRALAHVDFANRDLHIGRVIPSATQEEVLFSIRPELFIAMLVAGSRIADNEAIVISGAHRFSTYTGYLSTFRFNGEVRDWEKGQRPPDIIAIDAIVNPGGHVQYAPASLLRDTDKAYLGFLPQDTVHSVCSPGDKVAAQTHSEKQPGISTGNWGCGMFGGDVILKFVQQAMAASAAGIPVVHYSAFKNPDLAGRLRCVATLLQGLTVSEVWTILTAWHDRLAARRGNMAKEDILMKLAVTKGKREEQAVEQLRAGERAEEEGNMNNAMVLYRKAFHAWPDLDSPLDDNGVPFALKEQAESMLMEDNPDAMLTSRAAYITGSIKVAEKLATETLAGSFEQYLCQELASCRK